MKNLFNSLSMAFIGCHVPLIALRFADGGGSGAGDGDKGGEKGDPGNGKDKSGSEKRGDDKGDDDKDGEEEKKFSQSELDAAVEKRLARERRKWEREHPEAKKDDDKGGKEDGSPEDDGSAAKLAAANRKLVQAEAKAAALSLGVKPDRVAYAVRMADLGKVDVDDELGVDGDAVKKAVEQVLKDIPELKPAESPKDKQGPGFKVGADGDSSDGDKKASFKDAVAAYYKK